MNNIKLSFVLSNTNATVPLGAAVRVDGTEIFRNHHVQDAVKIVHELDDDVEGKHVLEIDMFGKLPEHTKIDDAGNILSDAMLELRGHELDGIEIEQIFQSLAQYHHSNNDPAGAAVTERVFSHMGCNGTVKFEFSTPGYLWLLENM